MNQPPPTSTPSFAFSMATATLLVLSVGWWLMTREEPVQTSAPKPAKTAAKASTVRRSSLVSVETEDTGVAPTRLVSTTPPPAMDALTKSILDALEKPGAVDNEAMLTFANKAALDRFIKRAKSYGLEVVSTVDGLNTARVHYSKLSNLRDLLSDPTADKPALEPNLWMTVPRLPKDDKSNQGGSIAYGNDMLNSIGATGDRSQWGKGITVAVLDTGIESHPTFASDQVTHLDLVNDGSAMHGHGTSVGSLIAGEDDRVPGVAPGAHLLDIRIANAKGISVSSVLAEGIIEASNRGAQVINISMGSYTDSQMLRNAVNYATQRGVIIVAAAGNEKYDMLAFPAAIPAVVSVASVDKNGRQAYFSNSGSGLDIAAPGVGLTTAWGSNMAAKVSGTSQSTGIVSGAIAAYLSWGIRSTDVVRRLEADARATGAPPNQVGSGTLFLRSH